MAKLSGFFMSTLLIVLCLWINVCHYPDAARSARSAPVGLPSATVPVDETRFPASEASEPRHSARARGLFADVEAADVPEFLDVSDANSTDENAESNVEASALRPASFPDEAAEIDAPPKATTKSLDAPPKATTKSLDAPPKATTKSLDAAPQATAKSLDAAPQATAKSLDFASKATAKSLDAAPKATVKSLDAAPQATAKSLDFASKATAKSLDAAPQATAKSLDAALASAPFPSSDAVVASRTKSLRRSATKPRGAKYVRVPDVEIDAFSGSVRAANASDEEIRVVGATRAGQMEFVSGSAR